MRQIEIMNGDVVLIRSPPYPSDGDIVAAQLDGNEVTLKRFFRKSPELIVLHPENSDMEDIIVTPETEFRILGVAVGLMRNTISR